MPDGDDAHYFDDDPTVPSDPITIDVTLPDTAFSLRTDRGVFSRGRLDTGTSLLLRADLRLPQDGQLLDLGCGSGAIALTMAKRSPRATVWAMDVNARARDLCASNAARNGVSNVVVCAPGEVPESTSFDAIWSNPPIRIGKPALRDLLGGWLGRLTADGTAALVVQKHLGADSLQQWLALEGYTAERVSSKGGFRVILVAASA